MTTRPLAIVLEPSEFAPYYARYISRVTSNNIVTTLEGQAHETKSLYGSLTEAQSAFRYAPDKWSVRQMLGHVIDAERIFSYRALRIARGDKTPIEGFEQDDYVRNAPFDRRTLSELLDEFAVIRQGTVLLFDSLAPDDWTRRGIASNNEVTVRALAYIIAGHELHHNEVLNGKYLPALKAFR